MLFHMAIDFTSVAAISVMKRIRTLLLVKRAFCRAFRCFM